MDANVEEGSGTDTREPGSAGGLSRREAGRGGSGGFRVRSRELEASLLGADPHLTREEVRTLAQVGEEEARALWGALGFPELDPEERAFTQLDVAALQTVNELRESGAVDEEALLILARTMGQGLARLAEAQVQVFVGAARTLTPEELLEGAHDSAEFVLPRLEQLMTHVWRRQFAAASARALRELTPSGLPELSVGFIDLVNFTRSTQEWEAHELEAVLERFERETSLRVAARGGRVIKTLGDAILFVCEDARDAAEIALETVEAHERDEALPAVRAGLAHGPVVVRLGDVFGSPVNLASRLVGEARPSSVLIDAALADALGEAPDYKLRSLRRRAVRGFRTLVPNLLRRG